MSVSLSPKPTTELQLADEFNYLYLLTGGFVIPGYPISGSSTTYALESNAVAINGTVRISPGAALCSGLFYVSDDNVDLTVDSSAGNNRIDRIILRDNGSKAIRLRILKGVEAASPAFPALTFGDVPIGWIWIPSGFNAATTQIAAENIHDDRVFRDVGTTATIQSRTNLLYNPEFIAYSGGAVGNLPPEGWRITVAPATSIINVAPLATQQRGWGVRIRGNANQGMRTTVRVNNNLSNLAVFTLRGKLSVSAGSVRVTFGAVSKDFYPLAVGSTPFEFTIRTTATSNELALIINANSAASDFTVGQLVVSYGYIAAYTHKHETIMLDQAITDAAWTASAKSTGVTLIDLLVSYGGLVARGARGLIVRMRCNDSGSAAGAAELYTGAANSLVAVLSEIKVDGLPNDSIREGIGFAPILQTSTTFRCRWGVIATGVGTLDATVNIVGIIT